MSVDRAVMIFAGLMIFISLALTHFVHPMWWLLTAFIGLNLIQSAFTGFCPAAILFKWLGFRPGAAFK